MMFSTALFTCATFLAAVSAQVVVNLPANLIVGAQIGDETCPAPTANDVNARVFAVVTLNERATVNINENLLPVGSILNLNAPASTTAVVNLGVNVCLCLPVGANTALTNAQTLNLDAQATTEIDDLLTTAAGTNPVTVALVNNALDLGAVTVGTELIPTSRTDCTCAANEIPGCTAGGCTCTPCPTGQNYNAATGLCTLAPSQAANRKRMTASRQSRNFF